MKRNRIKRIPDQIFRSNKGAFAITPVELLRHKQISLKAKGLYGILVSNVDGWSSSVAGLHEGLPEGKDLIRNALIELEEYEYLARIQFTKNGSFAGMTYLITDEAGQFDHFAEFILEMIEAGYEWNEEETAVGFSDAALSDVAFSDAAKPDHISNKKDKKERKEKSNKEIFVGISKNDFDSFWNIYPKVKGQSKGKAKSSWFKLCSKKDRPTLDQILKAVRNQKKTPKWKQGKYVPHAATWINQQRWLDEVDEMKASTTGSKKPGYRSGKKLKYHTERY